MKEIISKPNKKSNIITEYNNLLCDLLIYFDLLNFKSRPKPLLRAIALLLLLVEIV